MDIKWSDDNTGGVDNKGPAKCFNDIPIKNEAEIGTQHQPFSVVALEPTIKFENCGGGDDDPLTIRVKCELVEFHNDKNSSNESPNRTAATAKLEKITKTETKFTCSDDDRSYSSNRKDDIYNNSDNEDSDSNSNSDPERDPFADVDCDPSFSQTSQSSTDYSPTQDELINSADNLNESFSQKRIVARKLGKLQCGLCLETQSSERKLQTHLEICAPFQQDRHRFCVSCNRLFPYRQGYRRHALSEHGIKVDKLNILKYKCPFCACAFPLQAPLKTHITSCHGTNASANTTNGHSSKPKPFRCQECPSTFPNVTALRYHRASHKNEWPFNCTMPNCDKAFKLNHHLKQHLRSVHPEERPIRCQEPNCGKTFKVKDQLQKHMVCHSKDRPYKCSHANCNQAFPNQERLTKHLAAHRGARRINPNAAKLFKCGQCDLAFCKNWELTRHSKIHQISDNELLECPEPNCTKTFRQKGSLTVHISKIHTNKNERPFKCPEPNCGKAFKYKLSVQDHLPTHTGIRPFKCTEPQCSAAFTRNTYLNSHVKSKHRKSTETGNRTN